MANHKAVAVGQLQFELLRQMQFELQLKLQLYQTAPQTAAFCELYAL